MKPKLLLLVFLAIFLNSCSPTYYQEKTTILDFREYTKQGFIISPTTSGFEYMPISEINISFYPGGKLTEEFKGKRGIKKQELKYSEYYYSPSSTRMLDKIVEEAKNMGANGIVGFKSSYIPGGKYGSGYWNICGVAVVTKGNKLAFEDRRKPIGEIDGIKCYMIHETKDGLRIATSEELSANQIKRLISKLSLKQEKIQFNKVGKENKNQAYAGISDGYIIMYQTKEFIKFDDYPE